MNLVFMFQILILVLFPGEKGEKGKGGPEGAQGTWGTVGPPGRPGPPGDLGLKVSHRGGVREQTGPEQNRTSLLVVFGFRGTVSLVSLATKASLDPRDRMDSQDSRGPLESAWPGPVESTGPLATRDLMDFLDRLD